jgi:ParB-like chromosome segregation protein Spo0J
VAQIATSILEFGFTNPVLIDEEDGIDLRDTSGMH